MSQYLNATTDDPIGWMRNQTQTAQVTTKELNDISSAQREALVREAQQLRQRIAQPGSTDAPAA